MGGRFVGIVGAAVIALSVLGLVEHEERAGPYEVMLEPVHLLVHVEGTYHARGDSEPVPGFCPQPPCRPSTAVSLRFEGLPSAPYEARLEGDGRRDLGVLRPVTGGHVLQWSDDSDNTDKDRLVLLVAGRQVGGLLVGPSEEPTRISATIDATLRAAPAPARLNEIGGVTISTVAKGQIAYEVPPGWVLEAYTISVSGVVPLGPLGQNADGHVLDARVERLRLEEQQRLVVVLVPSDGRADGFPLLAADLPDHA